MSDTPSDPSVMSHYSSLMDIVAAAGLGDDAASVTSNEDAQPPPQPPAPAPKKPSPAGVRISNPAVVGTGKPQSVSVRPAGASKTYAKPLPPAAKAARPPVSRSGGEEGRLGAIPPGAPVAVAVSAAWVEDTESTTEYVCVRGGQGHPVVLMCSCVCVLCLCSAAHSSLPLSSRLDTLLATVKATFMVRVAPTLSRGAGGVSYLCVCPCMTPA